MSFLWINVLILKMLCFHAERVMFVYTNHHSLGTVVELLSFFHLKHCLLYYEQVFLSVTVLNVYGAFLVYDVMLLRLCTPPYQKLYRWDGYSELVVIRSASILVAL